MDVNADTTFRRSLVDELAKVVNSVELDEERVQMDFVENKGEVLGEYLDYYTDALLEYEPFVQEFAPSEIEELRKFLRYLREVVQVRTGWTDIRTEAANLLLFLTRR